MGKPLRYFVLFVGILTGVAVLLYYGGRDPIHPRQMGLIGPQAPPSGNSAQR